jgi:hypothetical protein
VLLYLPADDLPVVVLIACWLVITKKVFPLVQQIIIQGVAWCNHGNMMYDERLSRRLKVFFVACCALFVSLDCWLRHLESLYVHRNSLPKSREVPFSSLEVCCCLLLAPHFHVKFQYEKIFWQSKRNESSRTYIMALPAVSLAAAAASASSTCDCQPFPPEKSSYQSTRLWSNRRPKLV